MKIRHYLPVYIIHIYAVYSLYIKKYTIYCSFIYSLIGCTCFRTLTITILLSFLKHLLIILLFKIFNLCRQTH